MGRQKVILRCTIALPASDALSGSALAIAAILDMPTAGGHPVRRAPDIFPRVVWGGQIQWIQTSGGRQRI